MGKEKALSIRIDGNLRERIAACAKEARTTVSAAAEEALREYCERHERKRLRKRDARKALEAFRQLRGIVSDGSLSRDIDDDLYGPIR